MPNAKLPHDHGQEIEHIFDHLPPADAFSSVSGLFHLLGDGSRLRVFWILCHCEECVINLAAMTGMSSPALSHHLRLLKEAGLIVSRREGKEVYYKAADVLPTETLHRVIEELVAITCPKNMQREGEK